MIFVLLSLTLYASEPKLPDGISCDAIRQAVAEHGKFKSIRWARQQGYTWAQIAEARKCLR
jgi:hypothetical protein